MDPDFNHNGPGIKGNLFGMPYSLENAEIALIPVPWEVTVSFRDGTKNAPMAILGASTQIDLHIPFIEKAWSMGVVMLPQDPALKTRNDQLRPHAASYIAALESDNISKRLHDLPARINQGCQYMVDKVYGRSVQILDSGKIPGVVGGDHGTSLGLIQALGDRFPAFSILQIDAHSDLREAYENFVFSHASTMRNAMEINSLERLIQVGVRDFSEEEDKIIRGSKGRIKVHSDYHMKESIFHGSSWSEITKSISSDLTDNVYISFDIDGLDPSLCPHTGTPVPGGLSFEMAISLLHQVVLSGKKVIGFDLCEVSTGPEDNHEWDAIVGSRVLYYLSCFTGVSNGKLKYNNDLWPNGEYGIG